MANDVLSFAPYGLARLQRKTYKGLGGDLRSPFSQAPVGLTVCHMAPSFHA